MLIFSLSLSLSLSDTRLYYYSKHIIYKYISLMGLSFLILLLIEYFLHFTIALYFICRFYIRRYDLTVVKFSWHDCIELLKMKPPSPTAIFKISCQLLKVIQILMSYCWCICKVNESVTYSSQGSHTDQLGCS